MFIGLVALSVIIGLLIFLLTDSTAYPRVTKVGEIMFWTGWLIFLASGEKVVAIFKP